MWDTEKLLQTLLAFLVEGNNYDIVVQKHKATLTFLSAKKALVKDIAKYVERVDGKMPKAVIVKFVECELVFTEVDLVNVVLGVRRLEIVYKNYKVVINEHRS